MPYSIPARLELAARIADLPAIATVEEDADSFPPTVEVYIHPTINSSRKQRPLLLLCRIGQATMTVYGLDSRDRDHLLSRGWARLGDSCVELHLPRDDEELETCWCVLKFAYDRLIDIAANSAPMRTTVWAASLPKFSRTSLQ